jgi:hypothetical protein
MPIDENSFRALQAELEVKLAELKKLIDAKPDSDYLKEIEARVEKQIATIRELDALKAKAVKENPELKKDKTFCEFWGI